MKKPSVLYSANPQFYKKLRSAATELRKNPTEAEKILWEKLRNRNLGVKFRRQHIVHSFIVDFCSIEIGLVVELEGRIHNFRKSADFERSIILKNEGYRIIRFKNNEVIYDIEYVLTKISEELAMAPQDINY